MTATFAVWLLILLPVGQQPETSAKNDTAHQQAGKASGRVVLSEDKKPPHDDANTTDNKKRAAVNHPAPHQTCPERFCVWLKSLNNADWLLVVTTLYLFATFMIWRQMVKSNEHAETAYHESKKAADKDRDLMRRQLEVYERPWLKASVVFLDGLYFSADGSATAYFNPVIKNIGKSVASNVCAVADLVIVPIGVDCVQFAREQAMALTKSDSDVFTLFPDDTDKMRLIMPKLTKDAIDAGTFRGDDGFDSIELACIGAVFYEFATSEVPHVTRFSFILSRASRDGGHSLHIRVGYNLLANEITQQMNFVHHAD